MIERLNPALNAVVHRLYDMARASAETVDRSASFAGVPFLLKELASSWTGAPNTNSCSFLRDVVADFDTEVVRRMKAAGLVLVGKSNAPENGWSITTEPKLYGATKNPWENGITPGFERRRGGGRRRAHGADRRGQRWRRLDPYPGLLLWHRRPKAVARTRQPGALRRLLVWRRLFPVLLADGARRRS